MKFPYIAGVFLFVCACVCVWVWGVSHVQLFSWRYSPHLRQTCRKTRMITGIHAACLVMIWDRNSRKTANGQLFLFWLPKLPCKSDAKTHNPHAEKQTGANLDFCPGEFDKIYSLAAKLQKRQIRLI